MKVAYFVAALAWSPIVASAATQAFVEDVHYQRLPQPVATADSSRVEVVEVFSYACIHCRNFDPYIESWRTKQPEDVAFRRLPATFNQTWALLAQVFYAAQVLDVSDAVHEPIFRAIHDRGVDPRDLERMAALFQAAGGVAPEDFRQAFNSFGVRSRVQQADAHGRAYRVSGVPALIVDGIYRVDGRMAGSNASMLDVVDHLVALQRESKGLAAVASESAPFEPATAGAP